MDDVLRDHDVPTLEKSRIRLGSDRGAFLSKILLTLTNRPIVSKLAHFVDTDRSEDGQR